MSAAIDAFWTGLAGQDWKYCQTEHVGVQGRWGFTSCSVDKSFWRARPVHLGFLSDTNSMVLADPALGSLSLRQGRTGMDF